MQVLVVDAEARVCSELNSVLESRADIDGLDVATDGVDALDRLQSKSYDVLLLNIDLSQYSGIELLERLRRSNRPIPSVIFLTTSREQVSPAFEKHAVDCLPKPCSQDQIDQALNRTSRVNDARRGAKLLSVLSQTTIPGQTQPRKIGIKVNGRFLFVDPNEIVMVRAEGNYVMLQKEAGSYLLRQAISDVAAIMEQYGFIRIHRSVLVNKSFVEELVPYTKGECRLRMKGGKEYAVTRSYKKNLKSLAAYWLGTKMFPDE